ncbi:MAG: hydroxymethylbilane synthase [Deltaproteobacteria bacterium]|nr:hydroxymethylbilane synthase [Deltaproteobacteria bacterium]
MLWSKNNKKLRLGTRGSALALAQSSMIATELRQHHPDLDIEQVTIQTSGDKFKGDYLAEAGGKGLFAKEIEEALLKGTIDFAVHSLKDLPGILPDALTLACYPKREDARDCLISKKNLSLSELPGGSIIGTSSPRRAAQILSLRPDCKTAPIRGNVDTRLKKLQENHYDAIILAVAGLNRLKLDSGFRRNDVFHTMLDPEIFIPAVGQGILGIETRKNETALIEFLRETLEDPDTAIAARAERGFLAAVGGDCYSPIAAYATVVREQIKMFCWIGAPNGKTVVRLEKTGEISNPELLGGKLAEEALDKGGREILDAIARCAKT